MNVIKFSRWDPFRDMFAAQDRLSRFLSHDAVAQPQFFICSRPVDPQNGQVISRTKARFNHRLAQQRGARRK